MSQARDEAGNIWDTSTNPPTLVQAAAATPSAIQLSGPDPSLALDRMRKQADLEKLAREARTAPTDAAIKQAQLENMTNPKSAPPSGYRYTSKGDLEPIPGGPIVGQSGVKKGNGALDAIVSQINDVSSMFASGAGATAGLSGLSDYFPSSANKAFDAAASGLEDQAAMAFRVPGSGTVSDADAARIAAANKPDRFSLDAANRQRLRQLRIRVDAARDAAGLPPAKWASDSTQSEGSDKSTLYYANGGGGGSDMIIPTGDTRSMADPVRAGLNARVNAMFKHGEPDDKIAAYIQSAGAPVAPASLAAALAFRRKNPGYKGDYKVDLEDKEVPQSTARQAFQKIGSGPAGSFTTAAADALTAGRLDNIAGAFGGNQAQVDAAKRLLAQINPMSSIAGNVAGGALAMGGLEAGLAGSGLQAAGGAVGALARSPRAADAVYGATMGSDDPNNPLLGALAGGVLGVAGGALGQRVVGAARGVQDQAVQSLRARGIPLTVGQAVGQSGRVGQAIKGVEDRLSGLPGIGSMINARRVEGLDAFNRVALNEAAAPLAQQTTPLTAQITGSGPQGVEALRAARAAGYDNAVNGRFASADPAYDTAYQAALTSARAIPNTGAAVGAEIDAAVPGYFAAGSITGPNAQAAIKELKGIRRAHQTDPLGQRTGDAVRQAEAAMQGLFERQAPGFSNDLARANEVQTNLKTIEAAATNGANQQDMLFTPAQLNRASVQSANRLTGQGATTNRPFYDLATAGQAVLPNKVPDSGTAGRLALAAGLTGAGGAGGYATDNTGQGLAVGAALAALQTQAAQRALVAAVLNRPPRMIRAADLLNRYGVGSAIGAPVALQALPGR